MKLKPGCKDCILEQALICAKLSGADEEMLEKIEAEASLIISKATPLITAPVLASKIYKIIREYTDVEDPYLERKIKSAREAEVIYTSLKKRVKSSPDKLRATLVASAVGNIIDFGVPDIKITPEGILREYEELSFAIDDYKELKEELAKADKILFVADNAGEIVLDRLFLEWARSNLSAEIFFAVRGGPIINDATRSDATSHKIDKLANILDTGANVPGADLTLASEEFKRAFNEACLVISKGQGNFEVLEGEDKNIFFILKAKCKVIADYLDVEQGSLILMRNRPHNE